MANENLPALSRPVAIELKTLDDYMRFGAIVAKTPFAPKGLQTPEACCVALQFGAELGLSPVQSLQNIAPINGRPSVWGDMMLALCLASGKFDEEAFSETDDGQEATCTVRRLPFGNPITHTYSMDDAKKANLLGKGGAWQTNPRRMRQMRARGFALRDAFPDVLKGLYAREELMGEVIDVELAEPENGEGVTLEDMTRPDASAIDPNAERPKDKPAKKAVKKTTKRKRKTKKKEEEYTGLKDEAEAQHARAMQTGTEPDNWGPVPDRDEATEKSIGLAVETFAKYGMDEDDMVRLLGGKPLSHWNAADLDTLRKAAKAAKDEAEKPAADPLEIRDRIIGEFEAEGVALAKLEAHLGKEKAAWGDAEVKELESLIDDARGSAIPLADLFAEEEGDDDAGEQKEMF